MRRLTLIPLIVVLLGLIIKPNSVAARQICFPGQPAIKACLGDPFSGYWEANGGLPVFGYPVTDASQERNPDLNVNLLTQWTERNRLEVHPENKPPFNILLGRMGADRLRQIGRTPTQEGRESGPRAGCLWFETTGHNVCDQINAVGFKSYWQSHGLKIPGLDAYTRSLQLFGLPLTVARMETNASGDTVLTQWFERARFEWHPDKPDQFKVLLGLLGNEIRANPALVRPPSVFGAEITSVSDATAGKARDARISWTRFGSILWSEVEPSQGNRDWSRLAGIEAQLKTLAAQGLTTQVVVRGTPAWAQKVAGSSCGPIKPEALDAFASFMRELVTRYSRPPYNVKYWEVWNEQDVEPGLVAGDAGFGCWGDAGDPYYGGGYYAEMLKRIYPAMKQADASAQVMLGGLLLDCDPNNPPAGEDCKPSRFLEGVLRNGGGAAFDIVAYHAYTYWNPNNRDWDREQPKWKARGGTLLGKLAFLQSVEDRYNVRKPILMNEGGLLCYPGTPGCEGDAFRQAQANYAVRMYSRAWASGLLGASWYTLDGPGWREGGLLDAAQNPRPAYNTLRFMSGLLQDAVYAGSLGGGALEGYAFRKGDMTYQVYWTNDGSTSGVGLPAGTRTVYNKSGQPITAGGGSLQVGFEPVFIEIKNP